MAGNETLAKLKALAATAGPDIEPIAITIGRKVDKDGNVTAEGNTQTFHFKRLGYLRARHLQLAASKVMPNENGNGFSFVLDTAKLAERNLDMLTESLVDPQGRPFANAKELAALPPELGDALFNAAEKVNGANEYAIEELEGNSATTESADTSSS